MVNWFKRGKTTPPKRDDEQCYAGSGYGRMAQKYSNLDSEVDDALAKHGYNLYAQQMMADDQVKACVMIKELGVVVGGWSVQPAVGEGEDGYDQAQEIADFVSYALSEMDGTVERMLMNIAHAIVCGYSVQEKVWTLYEDGPYSGMVGLKAVKMKSAPTFTFNTDEFGNVINLWQTVPGLANAVEIPLDKLLLYTYDPQRTGQPAGVSDLRAAYPHYWSKRSQMKWRNVAAEKYACPTAVGHYPKGASKTSQENLLDACKAIVTDTAIVIPEDASIEFLQVTGSVMAPYDAAIDSCNKSIARAIFAQTLASNEGKDGSGSYAQAKVHDGILKMFLEGLRKEIGEEVLSEQLIKPLVDYNFVTDLYPKIVLAPPDERDLVALAGIMDVLLKGGVLNPNEPCIREEFGLPPKPQEIIEQEEAEKLAEQERQAQQLEALRTQQQNKPPTDDKPPTKPVPKFSKCTCGDDHDVFAQDAKTSIGQGEQPSDPRIGKAIKDFHKDLRAAVTDCQRDVWRILRLPDAATFVSFEDSPFSLTLEQEQAFNLAVERFIATMAGKERTKQGFVSAETGDGIIQQYDRFAHSLGVTRAVEMSGADAMQILPDRNGAAVQNLLSKAFDRLSSSEMGPDGQMRLRLEGKLGELQEIINEGLSLGSSPLEVAREMSAKFDAYRGWEFERLARTEVAFAQVQGQMDEYRAEGIDMSSVEADPPPWHPNCLCDLTIEKQEDGSWKAVRNISAQACPLCQAYAGG